MESYTIFFSFESNKDIPLWFKKRAWYPQSITNLIEKKIISNKINNN